MDFESFSMPILHALHALGINATLSGRNDIEIDQKKISGNAQHRVGTRLLHHGTLLFNTDTEVLGRVLRPNREKLTTRAIRSVKARVTNLATILDASWSKDRFLEYLCGFIETKYNAQRISPPSNQAIEVLARRNASMDWIFPEKELLARYTEVKKERYPFGTVELSLSMHNDKIEEISITGDFFGVRPVAELENLLQHTPTSHLKERLSSVPLSDYIFGMDVQALVSLISRDMPPEPS